MRHYQHLENEERRRKENKDIRPKGFFRKLFNRG